MTVQVVKIRIRRGCSLRCSSGVVRQLLGGADENFVVLVEVADYDPLLCA